MTPEQVAELHRAKDIHLRDHLTDGRWHDECGWCLVRRRHGGTGVYDGELCGDDQREWKDGQLIEHRPECFMARHLENRTSL